MLNIHFISKRFFCILIFLSLFSFKQYSQSGSDCKIKNLSTHSGETLHYKVYYTLVGAYIGAGEATFTNTLSTYNHKPVYHLKGVGKTYKSYDWFYKVRDVYESYVDTNTLLPVKFVRNVHEGSTQIYSQVLFKQNEKKAVSTNGSFDVPACVQDVLSAIYFARNIDFSKYKVGDKIPFSIFIDDQVFPIYIRFMGKEKLHTKYGEYHTIKFKPLLIDGTIFTGGEKMTVWVTDDLNKLPVLIETPILVGSIKVYLKSYEGLRNKTTAIIEE